MGQHGPLGSAIAHRIDARHTGAQAIIHGDASPCGQDAHAFQSDTLCVRGPANGRKDGRYLYLRLSLVRSHRDTIA